MLLEACDWNNALSYLEKESWDTSNLAAKGKIGNSVQAQNSGGVYHLKNDLVPKTISPWFNIKMNRLRRSAL